MSVVAALELLTAELIAALGADHVVATQAVREQHATGESYHQAGLPDLVVLPGSTDDVVAVVDACRRHGVALVPFGAGTSLEGQVVPLRAGVCLDTSRLDRILRLSVEDLDVSVQAGVTRKQLDARLRPEGVFFPVDPGADASIGGMVATGASGTTTVRYGAMRDNVLSLIVVTPDGQVVRTRSRARKSSAGYDLTHLFVGSEGTLGVITEVTLRVFPTPEAISSAVCPFAVLDDAVACVIQAIQLGIPVARIELLDDVQMDAVNRRSGLDYPVAHTLFLEFHGTAAEVAAQAGEVAALAQANGGGAFTWATSEDERRALWAARHQAYEASLALRPGSKGYITDVCVPLSELARSITEARAEIDAAGLVAPIVGHVGDGNFHVCFLVDPDDPAGLAQVRSLAERFAERAIAAGGTCTGEHGVGYGKSRLLPLEHGAEGVELMRTLKAALDPDDIMNPGKVLPPRE
ncbi:MAG TPA: FAD-linked oxidase C-terminal domain-containing protein [Gaiellaceae bacterium]|nr:FAD-linked oxidase C-terminal domain-containing protein [Gaiellaceae bacterium]